MPNLQKLRTKANFGPVDGPFNCSMSSPSKPCPKKFNSGHTLHAPEAQCDWFEIAMLQSRRTGCAGPFLYTSSKFSQYPLISLTEHDYFETYY